MVSNDMPSAPSIRALCSSSAATSISAMPGRSESQDVLKQPATQQRRLRHHRQLVLILHARKISTSGAGAA